MQSSEDSTPPLARKRILFVSVQNPWPTRGGTSMRLDSIVRALADTSEVVAVVPTHPHPTLPPSGVTLVPLRGGPHRKEIGWSRIVRWPITIGRWLLHPNLPLQVLYLNDPSDQLLTLLSNDRFDAVWIYQLELAALVGSRLGQLPVVVDADDDAVEFIEQEMRRNSLIRRRLLKEQQRRYLGLRRRLRSSGAVICYAAAGESSFTDNLVRNGLPDPGFIDVRVRAPSPGRIAFLGSLSYSANWEAAQFAACELLPHLQQVYPSTSLVVIGECSNAQRLLLQSHGVEVTGFVPNLDEALHGVSAMLVPLMRGSGTSIKAVEALGRGIPLLSTPIGVRGLGLEATRHYLEAEDIDQFKAAWNDFVNGYPEVGISLSTAGRRHFERFLGLQSVRDDVKLALDSAGFEESETNY